MFRPCMATQEQAILESLLEREELAEFGSNAIGMLALELRFGLDDLRTVADDALTDDSKDHKCDLLYVDRENGTAVIAQTYTAQDVAKDEPPSNKAADLNTALSWIFDGEVPARSSAKSSERLPRSYGGRSRKATYRSLSFGSSITSQSPPT
jgi:hypothetical protein